MQAISDAFKIGYLTNKHCLFFGAPSIAEWISRPLVRKEPSHYKSSYGRTNHFSEPAECGAWWYRFFRKYPAYVSLEDVSNLNMSAFRRSLASLGGAMGLPLIFKNLYASLRLEPIAHYVPNALFIVIERDWVDNGQSILKGRYDTLGDYGKWWSVPPPNVDELAELPPVQQVVAQIESIHDLIDRDLHRLGLEEQTFRIRYEDFCQDVYGTLDAFQAFMAHHGVDLERRFDVPAQFPINRSVKIPQSMYEQLQAEVAKRQERRAAVREQCQ